MLWSTLAAISIVTIIALLASNGARGHWRRARTLMIVSIAWGLNVAAGLGFFAMTESFGYGTTKALLVSSAFVFVGIVGAALYLTSRWEDDDEKGEFNEPGTLLAAALSLIVVLPGMAALVYIWLIG